MQKNVHLSYQKNIDGLRAIAVLSVIIYHAFPTWLPGGFIGVDIFYVISGFLISSILFKTLDKGYFSFLDFYQKRVRRIFPALMLVLTCSYIAGWFTLLGDDFKSMGKHLAYGTGFLSNFILLSESGYFDKSGELKAFLHLWSLGIEEQFYALWPLLVFFTYRKKMVFFFTMLLIILASFISGAAILHEHPSEAFYLPQFRAWELLLGALLAFISIEEQPWLKSLPTIIKRLFSPNIKAFVGLALLIAGIFMLNQQMSFPGWRALIPTIGAVLLISAGSTAWINRHIFANPVMVFLGLISYPLYLWHWPILVFSRIMIEPTLSVTTASLAIIVSIVLAFLTYRFIELPIKKSPKVFTYVLLAIAVAISNVGWWTYKNDGLTFRFPKNIQYLADSKTVLENMSKVEQSYRYDCFLLAAAKGTFSDECTDTDFKNNPRSLFLWGDSHAAMLYNGIMSVRKIRPFSFAQYTVASCGPFLIPNTQYYCPERAKLIMNKITELKPNVIILAARWEQYTIPELSKTIDFLKKAGVQHIIVVGQAPLWEKDLPAILVDAFNKNVPHVIPERVVLKYMQDQINTENRLKTVTEDSGVIYLSALQALCNETGCLATTGNELLDLTTLDYGHLTPSGSTYLMEKTLLPTLDKIWGQQPP